MSKYIIDTENISLDYDETRNKDTEGRYLLTLNDKYGHFEQDIYLRSEQLYDLLEGLKVIEQRLEREIEV